MLPPDALANMPAPNSDVNSLPPPFTHSASSEYHPQQLTSTAHSYHIHPHARVTSPYNSPFESYFDDAFLAHSSPSPPPANFFDTILNSAEPGPIDRRRAASPRRRRQSPVLAYLPAYNPSPMPSTRPSRLPNGYVDLTSDPDPPPEPQRRAKRPTHTPTPGPSSSKRLKRVDGTAAKRETKTPEAKIEEIDLSDEKTEIQDILQKQRVEAVRAQQKPEEKATTFNNFTCVICMDTPTDISATSCGHLFCHTCLMEALIAGENRSGPNEPKRSQCPVCRKIISRTKGNDIIPLLLKKGLATQPRQNSAATSISAKLGKGKRPVAMGPPSRTRKRSRSHFEP